MCFGAGIEVNEALLVAFSRDDTLALVEVDVRPVQPHKFSYTDTRRGEEVDHRQVALVVAVVAQGLHLLVADGALHPRPRLHLMDPAHRTLDDIVLLLQPREERRKDSTDVIYCNARRLPFLLEVGEVIADVLCGEVQQAARHIVQQMADGGLVVE